jgi:hypothetical protein
MRGTEREDGKNAVTILLSTTGEISRLAERLRMSALMLEASTEILSESLSSHEERQVELNLMDLRHWSTGLKWHTENYESLVTEICRALKQRALVRS